MYHIQNDKRAQKSARLICEGFLQCLNEKNIDQITISDIQRASSVSRATFYRLFDNTSDVLSYLCEQIFEKVNYEHTTMEYFSAEETTLRFIRLWMENRVLLKAIVDSNRMDFIYNAHMKYLAPHKEFFFPDTTITDIQAEYLMRTLTSCISAFLESWVKCGEKEGENELQEILKSCFKILGNIFD